MGPKGAQFSGRRVVPHCAGHPAHFEVAAAGSLLLPAAPSQCAANILGRGAQGRGAQSSVRLDSRQFVV
eukprot:10289149-Lingulodinium_polyedra.AAC.1